MLHFFIVILNFRFFAIISHHLHLSRGELVVAILQNTVKLSMWKTTSKNISFPHKLSQCMSTKLIIPGDPLCLGNTLKTWNWNFLIKINSSRVSLLFLKILKVTVTNQLKFLHFIAIYEKYCNSKEVVCDYIKSYFQVHLCLFFLLNSWKRSSFLTYKSSKNIEWSNICWQLSII